VWPDILLILVHLPEKVSLHPGLKLLAKQQQMKKLLSFTSFIILLATSCKRNVEEDVNPLQTGAQVVPLCGTPSVAGRQEGKSTEIRDESPASSILFFLDFNGATVQKGSPSPSGYQSQIILPNQINCPPAGLSPLAIGQIVDLVKDDYSPFNIEVTTDESVYAAYDPAKKHACIITTLPGVAGFSSATGGIAPLTSPGSRNPYNPCFVFSQAWFNVVKDVADVISHELAHTMGLSHQNEFNDQCGFLSEYHPGFGTGPLSFGVLMGNPYQKRITNWFAQSCISPLNGLSQNDFDLLSDVVSVRTDDFPDDIDDKTKPANTSTFQGILERPGDADFIYIKFKSPGTLTINSENIDLKASLYNPGGQLMATYNDPENTGITIPDAKGTRYLKIEAAGNANVSAQFMTGQYTVRY
jgi:hypothetical protein